MFPIEKDVPMPHCKARPKYPFAEMEVGDSFIASNVEHGNIYGTAAFYSLRTSCGKIKFSTKKISDTEIRVTRTV